MSVESNGIQALFDITAKIPSKNALEFKITLKNISDAPVKLNALLFDYATVMLRARKADTTPIPPGPPPFPPEDNGVEGRIVLQPGQSEQLIYHGSDYFQTDLPDGKYQMMFSYSSPRNSFGDWNGTIESPWINFEIISGQSMKTADTVKAVFSQIAEDIGCLIYDMRLLEEHINDAISMLIDKDDRSKGYEYIKDFSVNKKITVFTGLAETFFKSKAVDCSTCLTDLDSLLHMINAENDKYITDFWPLFRVDRTQLGSLADENTIEYKAFEQRLSNHIDKVDQEVYVLSSFIQKEIREKIYT